MLSEIFTPFVKASPVSVMVTGLLARGFSPEALNRLFRKRPVNPILSRSA
jgi:hypothetical protein